MKTFLETVQPAKPVQEEIVGFPTFSDVRSAKYKASVKEKEVTDTKKKLEELNAELEELKSRINHA
jgi:peptidoglycan hydrolase CwlO-like protein